MTGDVRALRLDLAGLLSLAAWSWLAWHADSAAGAVLGSLLAALALGWLAFALGVSACAGRATTPASGRRALVRIAIWGLAFRLVALVASPVLEDDWNRYLWDGYRFAQSGTPYGAAPMASFGDPDVPPEFEPVLDRINNPDLPTIYGPVPQYAFLAAYRIAPASIVPLRGLLLLAELATLVLLWRRTRSATSCLLWFWCPLLVFESAFNVHPESLGVLAIVAAIVAASSTGGSGHGGPIRAALCAGVAAASRPFGAMLAPFVIPWRRPAAWIVFGLTVALLYAPFVLYGGGEGVSLAAMAGGWEFNSSLYAVSSMLVGRQAALGVSAGLFGIVYLALLARHLHRPSDPPHGELVLGALFLVSPVLNPWYLLWLAPFAALRPAAWSWTALAVVSLSYVRGQALGDPALGGFEHPPWVRLVEFGAIAVTLGYDVWRARRGRRIDGERTRRRVPLAAGFATRPGQ